MSSFKSFAIYSLSFFSLLLGLALGENSSGGAKIDFEYLFPYVEGFSLSFKDGMETYISNTASIIHSPIFYILTSFIYKLIDNIIITKILYIFLCSFLPLIFFFILRDKFKINKNVLFFFSLIIFLSPYFRSSAIWLLGDNLSLIFFGLSIFYFNKVNELNNDKFKNHFLCLFFLVLCCYIRYYYCLFSLYYLFFFYQNLKKKYFLLLVTSSLILTFPAIFYFYLILLNYDFATTVINYSQFNIYRSSLIILSILLFYLIPFCIPQKALLLEHIKNNKKVILIFLILYLIIYFIAQFFFTNLINFSSRGGGVFMKIANLNNINPLLFLSLISFVSLIVLDFFFKEKRFENYSLLIILILTFPIFTIYQKYFDPLFFFIFFGLIKSSELKNIFLKGKNFLIPTFTYFSFFYFFSLIYYSKGFN
tara:strand:- start:166 stop:1431 length:1266 start_codon:yes stop_codon:yes gene_type:complete